MEVITLNKSIGRTRRETLGGRNYIVAPLSMLVPGVLNGSRGPLLYPPELVNRNPAVWNHMPIVVYHPMDQGKPTSARDPFIINKQGIGFVFKSRDNGRAEGWFDVENTKRVDPRVYDALVKNQPMELSTGLFTKNAKAPANSTFRGKAYVEIVKDFTPDHLAILPDQKGACSMKDGCGMLINGSKNQPRDENGRWGSAGGGAAKSLAGHLTAEKLGDPSEFRSLYTDLDDADKKQATKVLASVGLLHPVDAKKRTVMTGTEVIASASGQYKLAKENHEYNPLNRHVSFKESDQYKKMTANSEGTEEKPKSKFRQLIEGLSELVDNFNPNHHKQPRSKTGKFNSQTDAKANAGAANDSHETIKDMQTPGNTTKLAVKLMQLVKNSEGSQFGEPHNNVKEKPNMARKRQVNNDEEPVTLTEEDREVLIEGITGNCECDLETDRETLNSLSDEMLSRLALNAIPPQFLKGKKKKAAVEEEEAEEDMEDDEEEVPAKKKFIKNQAAKKAPAKKEAMTVNKSHDESPKLDAKTQFLVNYAERKMQEEKDTLIEKLTANVDEDDKDEMVEVLNEESIDKLEMMVKLLPKEEKREPVQNQRSQRGRSNLREQQTETKQRASFVGAGGSLPRNQAKQVNNSNRQSKEDEDDGLSGPMVSPTLNYAEVAGYKNGTFVHRNNLGLMQTSDSN